MLQNSAVLPSSDDAIYTLKVVFIFILTHWFDSWVHVGGNYILCVYFINALTCLWSQIQMGTVWKNAYLILPSLGPRCIMQSSPFWWAFNWYQLGMKLGVPDHKLDEIERNHPTDGVTQWRDEVLCLWLRLTPNASWKNVKRALQQMGGKCTRWE